MLTIPGVLFAYLNVVPQSLAGHTSGFRGPLSTWARRWLSRCVGQSKKSNHNDCLSDAVKLDRRRWSIRPVAARTGS